MAAPEDTIPAGPIDITVRDRSGAYATPRIAGRTASSTMSAQEAAQRLADKLWGRGSTATLLQQPTPGVSQWRIGPGASEAGHP